ncbi:tetratricopeptide repeat protein [Leptospira sp. 96542]|nr:tetratricopeptide repeat protein [Leptospira sp. 96542]
MKKIIFVTMAVLGFTISLHAWEIDSEDTDSLLSKYDKDTLTSISNELVKIASEEEASGEFELASGHYTRALKIREAVGLDQHKSYASILYLASIAHSKAGNYCEATKHAKKASESFQQHGIQKYMVKANQDMQEYAKACAVLAYK